MKMRKREDKKIEEQKTALNLDGKDIAEIFDILAEEDKT
jgi:hypothetical protein